MRSGLPRAASILVELAGFHARHHARNEPTFLLLDEFLGHSQAASEIDMLLERLQEAAEHAQVAIVGHSRDIDDSVPSEWVMTTLEPQLDKWHNTPIDFEVTTKTMPQTTGRD